MPVPGGDSGLKAAQDAFSLGSVNHGPLPGGFFVVGDFESRDIEPESVKAEVTFRDGAANARIAAEVVELRQHILT